MAVVLVAGGTGFIGSHIVRRLAAVGHGVIVMSRNPGKARAKVPEGVEIRAGDTGDAASLGPALEGADVAVSTVQFPNHPVENPRRGHTYIRVDGEAYYHKDIIAGDTSLVRVAASVYDSKTNPKPVATTEVYLSLRNE